MKLGFTAFLSISNDMLDLRVFRTSAFVFSTRSTQPTETVEAYGCA